MSRGVIERYGQFLPITEKTPITSLDEGSTPFVRVDRLAQEIGFKGKLYLKYEGANPTGSFKDRGMTVTVSKALEEGAEILMCASTGNTASSAAAYGAAAGLQVSVLVPKGGVAQGKLGQMRAYGAEVITIDSGFDACQDLVRKLGEKYPQKIRLVNSINPHRLEGQKTAAFEICEELGCAPNHLFIPVGNAGNITAYWMGFKEWGTAPRMMGYQAAGAAPIVVGHVVPDPQTVASAIRVGNPVSWQGALKARDESGGKIDCVTDDEILAAYRMIPRLTGFFCEPASAASVAGLIKAIREYSDFDNSEETATVCVLTGNGLKDPDSAKKFLAKKHSRAISADLDEVMRYLKL